MTLAESRKGISAGIESHRPLSPGRRPPRAVTPERVLRLTVDRMAFEGRAVGRTEGKVCFVRGALPGEQVDVTLEREHSRYDEGRVLTLLTSSPHRISAPCPVFGTCGGCDFLHCAYEEQIRIKTGFIRDAFRQMPDAALRIEDTEPSPEPFFTRNRAAYSVQDTGSGFQIGFHSRQDPGSIVSAEHCVLQSEAACDLLRRIREALDRIPQKEAGALRRIEIREGKNTGQRMIHFFADHEGIALQTAVEACRCACDTAVASLGVRPGPFARTTKRKHLFGEGTITETLGDHSFEIGPDAFFQTHTAIAAAMFGRVHKAMNEAGSKHPLELYAGSGVLATILAEPGRKLLGFEADADAVETARRNFKRNHVETARILHRRVEDLRTESLLGKIDFLVADPPRAGLSLIAARILVQLQVPRMVYISCQPAVMARDIQTLVQKGGYRVDWIKPFDMFPQTTHVETAIGLSR